MRMEGEGGGGGRENEPSPTIETKTNVKSKTFQPIFQKAQNPLYHFNKISKAKIVTKALSKACKTAL